MRVVEEEEELVKFVDDNKLYSIDDLVEQIQRKKQAVKEELAIILNENYIKFIKLNEATKTNSIEYLQGKVDQIKYFFTSEQSKKQYQYNELSVLLHEKLELLKLKESIKIQTLVIEKTSLIDSQLKNEIDFVTLQRIAFDYSQLKFYANSIKNDKTIQNELESLKIKFIKKLEKFIKDSIINQKDSRKILLVCEQLDQTSLFAVIFKNVILEEFLITLQQKEYSSFIKDSIEFIKKYHEMDKVYALFCKDKGLILICFEGITTQFMDQFTKVFVVSDMDEFCVCYELYLQFVQYCESCMGDLENYTTNVLKSNLDSTENTGNSLKSNVDSRDNTGNALKSNVDSTENTGNALESNVDSRENTGNALKSNVDSRESTGINALKSNVDSRESTGINALKSSKVYEQVSQKWQLSVYFQLKFNQIIQDFEMSLVQNPFLPEVPAEPLTDVAANPDIASNGNPLQAITPVQKEVKVANVEDPIDEDNKIQMNSTKQLQKSLATLWKTGTFPKLLPKTFKSTILV